MIVLTLKTSLWGDRWNFAGKLDDRVGVAQRPDSDGWMPDSDGWIEPEALEPEASENGYSEHQHIPERQDIKDDLYA